MRSSRTPTISHTLEFRIHAVSKVQRKIRDADIPASAPTPSKINDAGVPEAERNPVCFWALDCAAGEWLEP